MGLINPHFEAFKPDYNEDQVVEIALRMRASFAVIMNDAKAAKKLQDAGIIPIFRVLNAWFNDDSGHDHFDAKVYLEFMVAAARAAGCDVTRMIFYYINEAGNASMPKLKEQLRLAIEAAKQLGIKLCVLNIAIWNWTLEDWEYIEDELDEVAYVGFHEGYYNGQETLDLAEAAGSIGRFEYVLKRFHLQGRVIITEFAGSLTAHDGWRALYKGNWQLWAQRIREAMIAFYARYNIPICLFTAYSWRRDFDYYREIEFQQKIAELNLQFIYLEEPLMVNMRDLVCPSNGPLRKLNSGEIVQTVWNGSFGYQYKNSQWEQFCIKTMAGVDWVCRLMDISEYLAPRQSVYALFEDKSLTKPGGAWVPVNAEVGKVYTRDVWVQEYWRDGRLIPEGTLGSKTGRDVTYFKVVKVHPTWATFEGVQVQNVAECVYGHDYTAVVAANAERSAGVKERYFYSGGLVGFIDYNFTPPSQTVLTPSRDWPNSRPAPIQLPWWNPQMTTPTIPAGQTPYTAKAIDAVKLRPAPGLGTSNLFNPAIVIPKGSTVTLFETPAITDTPDEWTWVRCESVLGNGFAAREFFERVQSVPVMDFEIAVPYFSQIDAKLAINDCFPACGTSLIHYEYPRHGIARPSLISVDDLTRDSDLMRVDDGLGCSEGVTLLKGYGLNTIWYKALTVDDLPQFIEDGKPPILLVNSKYIGYTAEFGHFILALGYKKDAGGKVTHIKYHDPYSLGANQIQTATNMKNAMNDVGKFTPHGPGQAVILT